MRTDLTIYQSITKLKLHAKVSQRFNLQFISVKITCVVGWASSCYVQHPRSCDNCVRSGLFVHTDNSVHRYWTQHDVVFLEHVVKPLSPSLDHHKRIYNHASPINFTDYASDRIHAADLSNVTNVLDHNGSTGHAHTACAAQQLQ